MILTHDFLRGSQTRSVYESVDSYQRRIIYENNRIYSSNNQYDIFLSHSYLDREEVLNLVQLFNNCGYSVYVDWIYDYQLDRNSVSVKTAELLRKRMNESKGLAYLATGNSTNSKWCPWEMGYFDGKSENSRCCILPILNYSSYSYQGQEYLGLYPYLQYEKYADRDTYDFWVHEQNSSKYIPLRSWLHGFNPVDH